jgi:cation diffusion facilitator CzcD-associated flavoprotein CzcO
LANRTADAPVPLPERLPGYTEKTSQPRFSESSIYPYLETNVHSLAMEFTHQPFPSEVSAWSQSHYGISSPFRHWESVKEYLQDVADLHASSPGFVEYNTTVECARKVGEEWNLTLRKEGPEKDFWWEEHFDAVVVASGHWSVPFIPSVPGLEEFEREKKGSVVHSKHYRGREAFKGKVRLSMPLQPSTDLMNRSVSS